MVEKGYNKCRGCEEGYSGYNIEREGGNRDELRGRIGGGGDKVHAFSVLDSIQLQ